MKRIYWCLVSCFVWLFLLEQMKVSAQETVQGRPVDPTRYDLVKGSPFMFGHWVMVNIISSGGGPIEEVPVNFNGYTQNFEMIIDGKNLEIELGYFIGMQLAAQDSACGRQLFLKLLHPKMINKYPFIVFNGFKHRLLRDFSVTVVENKIETPGKTEKFKSFKPTTDYFLMKGSELMPLRLTLKDVLQKIDDPKAEDFIEENSVDVTTESGMCELLSFLEKS